MSFKSHEDIFRMLPWSNKTMEIIRNEKCTVDKPLKKINSATSQRTIFKFWFIHTIIRFIIWRCSGETSSLIPSYCTDSKQTRSKLPMLVRWQQGLKFTCFTTIFWRFHKKFLSVFYAWPNLLKNLNFCSHLQISFPFNIIFCSLKLILKASI